MLFIDGAAVSLLLKVSFDSIAGVVHREQLELGPIGTHATACYFF